MPKHGDFEKIYNRFVSQYGAKEGAKYYYSWANKHGYDDTKPFPKKGKKERICIIKGVELKEDATTFHVEGFIATSHVDECDDIIPKETLESFANQINTTARAGYHGVHHSEAEGKFYGEADRSNPARVLQLADGEYGLWADTKYIKGNPEVNEIISSWQKGEYDAFSITYDTDGFMTTDFDWRDDKLVRVIGPDTQLYGYTATDIPMNPQAKAIGFGFKELKELKLEEKMPEKEEVKGAQPEVKEETPVQEPIAVPATEQPAEIKEQKNVVSDELKKEIKESIMKEIAAEIKETKPEKKPMLNAGEKKERPKMEKKELEFKEKYNKFKELVLENKGAQRAQYKACIEMKEYLKSNGYEIHNVDSSEAVPFEIKEEKGSNGCWSKIELKENRFETKVVTTDEDYSGAQTTYVAALSNYEQAPARYNDIYGPYIINQLNDQTTFWNLLPKDDFSGMSAITFRARKGRNATADTYPYGSTPGWDSNASLMKCNLHFVTSYVEVAAEWEAIELGRGAGGIDVYKTELEFGALDLMTYINGNQLFGTGDGTSETESLGMEVLGIQTGNLYGRDRTSLVTLKSGGYDNMSSASITLDQMRKMIETVVANGARIDDLVFVTSLRQRRFIYQLIQDMQRTVPTSPRVGFTGNPEIDGIPIFSDKDLDAQSKQDDLYLVDTRHTRLAIKKAPTYVEMAQVTLQRRGVIWMMWNLYCTAPNHNYWAYGLATS